MTAAPPSHPVPVPDSPATSSSSAAGATTTVAGDVTPRPRPTASLMASHSTPSPSLSSTEAPMVAAAAAAAAAAVSRPTSHQATSAVQPVVLKPVIVSEPATTPARSLTTPTPATASSSASQQLLARLPKLSIDAGTGGDGPENQQDPAAAATSLTASPTADDEQAGGRALNRDSNSLLAAAIPPTPTVQPPTPSSALPSEHEVEAAEAPPHVSSTSAPAADSESSSSRRSSHSSSSSLPQVDGHPLGPFGWEGENTSGDKQQDSAHASSEAPDELAESPTSASSSSSQPIAMAESPTAHDSPVDLAESPTNDDEAISGGLLSTSPTAAVSPDRALGGGAAHLWQRTALRARGKGRPCASRGGDGTLAQSMGPRPAAAAAVADDAAVARTSSPLPSPTVLAESPLGAAIDRDPMETLHQDHPRPASPRTLPSKTVSAPVARPADVPSTVEMDDPEPPADLRRATLDPSATAAATRPRSHKRRTSSSHRVTETLDARIHADASGRRMVNQYAIGPTIGKGAYGNVEKAVDVGTGTPYAIKEFSKGRLRRQRQMTTASRLRRRQVTRQEVDKDMEATLGKHKARAIAAQAMDDPEVSAKDPLHLIRREVAVMKKLDHPNLVSLFEAIDVPTSDSLYMVLEYLPGGTIMDIHVKGEPTEPLEVELARDYFRQLVLGLEYLHENGVAHRDIKPDNILLTGDRKTVKLCDFGVSEMFEPGDDDLIQKSAGSPAFMSPEAAVSSEQEIHAKAVDIWALGITLYCMLRGRLPFVADTPIQLYEAIRDSPAPIPQRWDTDVKALIAEMLRKDPQQRIKMGELKVQPWVTRRGKEPLPTTEENLFDIGQEVVEPTAEEISKAITNWRGVFTVIRAIQKMKRPLRKSRQNSTSSSQGGSSAASLSPFVGPRTMSPKQDSGSETFSPQQTTVGTSFDDYDDDKGDFA